MLRLTELLLCRTKTVTSCWVDLGSLFFTLFSCVQMMALAELCCPEGNSQICLHFQALKNILDWMEGHSLKRVRFKIRTHGTFDANSCVKCWFTQTEPRDEREQRSGDCLLHTQDCVATGYTSITCLAFRKLSAEVCITPNFCILLAITILICLHMFVQYIFLSCCQIIFSGHLITGTYIEIPVPHNALTPI